MDFKSAVSLLLILTATFSTFECAPPTHNDQGVVSAQDAGAKGPPKSESTTSHVTQSQADLMDNKTTTIPPSSTTQNITTPKPAPTSTHTPNVTTHAPPTPKPSPSPSPSPSPKPSPSPSPTTSPTPTSPSPTTIKPTPAPSPAPKPDDRSFDFPSFMGGAILTLGLISISYVVYKYYRSRSDAYRTL